MDKVIIDRQVVADDPWQLLDAEAELPSSGDIIVPWSRWQTEKADLQARDGRVGVLLNGEDDLAQAVADMDKWAVIALQFPLFKDGRCYSYAKLLRDRYSYTGELRAVGDVWCDQIFNMARVGINAFAIRPQSKVEDALKAFDDFSLVYQPAADAQVPVWQQLRA